MAEKLQNQLKEVGSNLENPPATKDALIDLLTQAATCLSEMDQSPHKDLLESMQPLLKAIVKPELLKHQDNQIKLLVATCTCEITRITAPEAPYDDDVLRDIFHLFVSTFVGLKDTKDPSFGRIVNILDTVAKYRSFVVMLDLECDDLVKEMFKTFFTVVSDEHSETVTVAMETIMAVLLEESEDIEEDLLLIVLSILGRNNKDISSAARKLAMNVIKQCAEKIEAGIKKLILSSIKGDKSSSNSQIDYHEVIYDIYRCAPQAVSQIVPNLTKELQVITNEVVKRQRLVLKKDPKWFATTITSDEQQQSKRSRSSQSMDVSDSRRTTSRIDFNAGDDDIRGELEETPPPSRRVGRDKTKRALKHAAEQRKHMEQVLKMLVEHNMTSRMKVELRQKEQEMDKKIAEGKIMLNSIAILKHSEEGMTGQDLEILRAAKEKARDAIRGVL